MAELAIIYWIPWSVGATVQKGPQNDVYVAQHNQKQGQNSQKFQNNSHKMAIFSKMANGVTELTILDWVTLAMSATVQV